MNVDSLLKDTFAAREHLAGDSEDIVAAVRERIAHRPSPVARPLVIAAGVIAIAGAVSGAVVVTHHDSPMRTAPAHQAAGLGHHAPTVAAGIAPLTMPYDLGWLPDGSVAYQSRRINTGNDGSSRPVFDGEYLLTVTTAGGTTDIDVQQMPGDLADYRFKSGPGRPITINGRPGIEITNTDGSYESYFEDASGGTMYISVTPEKAGQATEVTGRRIAGSIRFPGSAQVTPSFGIGYLPAGTKIRAFEVANGSKFGGPVSAYEIWTSTRLQVSVATVASADPGASGRAVQGHPTRHKNENGYRTLYVLDAVNGRAVMLSGAQPLAELYRIADGLVLPK